MTDKRDHYEDPLPVEAAMRLKLSALQLRLVADFLREEVLLWSRERPGIYRAANERIGYIAHRLESLANAAISSLPSEPATEAQPFGAGWIASEAEMLALRRWMYRLTPEDFERHTDSLKAARLAQSGLEKMRMGFNDFELEPEDEKSPHEEDDR